MLLYWLHKRKLKLKPRLKLKLRLERRRKLSKQKPEPKHNYKNKLKRKHGQHPMAYRQLPIPRRQRKQVDRPRYRAVRSTFHPIRPPNLKRTRSRQHLLLLEVVVGQKAEEAFEHWPSPRARLTQIPQLLWPKRVRRKQRQRPHPPLPLLLVQRHPRRTAQSGRLHPLWHPIKLSLSLSHLPRPHLYPCHLVKSSQGALLGPPARIPVRMASQQQAL